MDSAVHSLRRHRERSQQSTKSHSNARSKHAFPDPERISLETDYTSALGYNERHSSQQSAPRPLRKRWSSVHLLAALVLLCLCIFWQQNTQLKSFQQNRHDMVPQYRTQMLADFMLGTSALKGSPSVTQLSNEVASIPISQSWSNPSQLRQISNVSSSTSITEKHNTSPTTNLEPQSESQQIDKLLGVNLLNRERSVTTKTDPAIGTGFQHNSHIRVSDNLRQCAAILTNPNSLTELVYWEHHPTDYLSLSLWHDNNQRRFLTFEPDTGGFASQRMVLEHMIVLAYALGRTLVLPSRQGMRDGTLLSYEDFFGIRTTLLQYKGLRIISMQEFLKFVALPGHLKDPKRGVSELPPGKRTNWDSAADIGLLYRYLRTVGTVPFDWNPQTCILGYKSDELKQDLKRIFKRTDGRPPPVPLDFQGKPTSAKAPTIERLREFLAERREVCNAHIDSIVLHIPTKSDGRSLLYAPFYSFFFFDDYHQDLLVKRMVRDHVRYNDIIVCAAARIVDWLRVHSGGGVYHAIHVRGPAFEDAHSDVNTNPAWIIHDIAKYIPKGSTVYIATDQTDSSWFDPLREQYHLYFASDFRGVFDSLMPWYLEMVEQLICAQSRTFVGTYYSNFSGYINRLRGYYSEQDHNRQTTGEEGGVIESYYASPVAVKKDMKLYRSLRRPFWMREFPTAWLDINQDVITPRKR